MIRSWAPGQCRQRGAGRLCALLALTSASVLESRHEGRAACCPGAERARQVPRRREPVEPARHRMARVREGEPRGALHTAPSRSPSRVQHAACCPSAACRATTLAADDARDRLALDQRRRRAVREAAARRGSLEGELKRSGKLLVKTSPGSSASTARPSTTCRGGACAQATHFLIGAVAGRVLAHGRRRAGQPGAASPIGEAGVKRELSAEQLRSAGDFDSCGQAPTESPHGNCASPIQVFLRRCPAAPPRKVRPAPSRSTSSRPTRPPLGRLRRRPVICTTPCARFVNPSTRSCCARATRASCGRPTRSRCRTCSTTPPRGACSCRPTPPRAGKLATGLTFTASPAWPLSRASRSPASAAPDGEHDGMCTGGIITLAVAARCSREHLAVPRRAPARRGRALRRRAGADGETKPAAPALGPGLRLGHVLGRREIWH